MALREVNDKHDGIADWLLPNTTLRYAYQDSKCDASIAVRGSLTLAFQEVAAVVGAWCSGASISSASLLSVGEVPQISYGSMSDRLSDGIRFPYFARTVPAVAIEGFVIADMIDSLFGYTSIAIVFGSDEYGRASEASVRTEMSYQVTILDSIMVSSAR